MKKDLKDIIINTGRHCDDAYASYRYKSHKKDDLDSDYWNIQRETIARYEKSQADRLAPLIRYLESQCGKPWYKVWHDICEDNDNRTIRGHHLREHVLWMVYDNGISKESPPPFYWRRGRFHVDKNGILRKNEDKRNRKKVLPKNDFILRKDKEIYILSNFGWYRTPSLCNFHYYTSFSTAFHIFESGATAYVKDSPGDDRYLPARPKYLIQRNPRKGFEFISYRDLCELYSAKKLVGCIISCIYQQASWKEIEIALGQKKSK